MSIHTRRGYQFEREAGRYLASKWLWHFKIPDARAMQGFNMPSAPQVPADFCGITEGGKFGLCEAKQTKGMSLPLERLKPHQEAALRAVRHYGGQAFLLVSFNNRVRGKERQDRCFELCIQDWLEFKIRNPEKKSCPLKYFEEKGIELKLEHDEKGRYWIKTT